MNRIGISHESVHLLLEKRRNRKKILRSKGAKGKYNSADSCYLFVTNRQLNRQIVQWVVYLAVCRVINSSIDTQTHGDPVHMIFVAILLHTLENAHYIQIICMTLKISMYNISIQFTQH